jgi:hypothetical protein
MRNMTENRTGLMKCAGIATERKPRPGLLRLKLDHPGEYPISPEVPGRHPMDKTGGHSAGTLALL